jgi:hypothetical protein
MKIVRNTKTPPVNKMQSVLKNKTSVSYIQIYMNIYKYIFIYIYIQIYIYIYT